MRNPPDRQVHAERVPTDIEREVLAVGNAAAMCGDRRPAARDDNASGSAGCCTNDTSRASGSGDGSHSGNDSSGEHDSHSGCRNEDDDHDGSDHHCPWHSPSHDIDLSGSTLTADSSDLTIRSKLGSVILDNAIVSVAADAWIRGYRGVSANLTSMLAGHAIEVRTHGDIATAGSAFLGQASLTMTAYGRIALDGVFFAPLIDVRSRSGQLDLVNAVLPDGFSQGPGWVHYAAP